MIELIIQCLAQWVEKAMAPTPILLPGKSHGRRSLVGCSPWGREESDTTEQLQFHFSLSFAGEGNGNPLQYSCLENTRDRWAWWAAVYGVAESRTRLKWLSSSSCSKGKKSKNTQMGPHPNKNLCIAKETINKMKKQSTEWKKYWIRS